MKWLRPLYTGLVLSGLACSVLTPAPGGTPALPSATTLPSPTALAATATAIATAITQPAATATPRPSPTPQGFYEHATGFSLILPQPWEIVRDTPQGLLVRDPASNLMFSAYNALEAGQPDIDEAVETLLGAEASSEAEEISRGHVRLGGDLRADRVDIGLKDEAGRALVLRLVYILHGGRAYYFVVLATPEVIQSRRLTLERIFESIRLSERVFGLDRQSTLALLGGDPEPEALDPARTTGSAAGYVGYLFSGLVRLTPQLQIEPDLAERWTTSPDGTVYTFTLRADLKFQSGAGLTAQDVKYSWERALNPETESTTAATYLGDIAGAHAMLAGEAESLSGVTVLDPLTLQVTLTGPRPYFVSKLTYPVAYVVNRSNVAGSPNDWMVAPDASGPYGLREYLEGQALTFERNHRYHAPASIEYVLYYFWAGGSEISLYEAGQIDILALYSEDALRVRREADPLHAEWTSTTAMCTQMLQFDVSKPPLDDLKVRQALALAFDRDALITRFSDDLDLRADSILPPGMPGYGPAEQHYAFNLKTASDRLAESSYAGRLPPIILNEAGFGNEASDFITAVANMWRDGLGVEISIEFLDPFDFEQAARDQGGHIVTYGWCADYPDPQNFLDILYHSDSQFNVGGYANPQVDAWLEEARAEPDPARRLQLYQQAEALILEEVGSLPWRHGVSDYLVKPHVKGYVPAPIGVAQTHRLQLDYAQELSP